MTERVDSVADWKWIEHQTKEEKELHHLRECLHLKRWCPNTSLGAWDHSEASWMLVGIAPGETTDKPRVFGGYLLPRTRELFDFDIEDLTTRFETELLRRLAYVSSFLGGDSRPPPKIIALALKHSFVPPWLEFAKADIVCRNRLPKEAYEVGGTLSDYESKTSAANRKKALDRHADSDGRALIEGAGRDAFERARDSNFAGMCFASSNRVNANTVAKYVHKEIVKAEPDDSSAIYGFDTTRKYVGQWLEDMDKK